MSMIDEFKNKMANQIQFLSQDEGCRDDEIAEIIGCSRATVNRTRIAKDIPTANLRNRKDKKCVCDYCKKEWMIRRWERRTSKCESCTVKHAAVSPAVEEHVSS